VEPQRHGVHGFTKTGSRRAGDNAPKTRELINLSDIEIKTYPELLDEAGQSVGLVNPLPLWPPIEFSDGYCISGMLTPPSTDDWVKPESLESELCDFNYQIDVHYNDRPYGFVDDALFNEVSLSTLYNDMFAVLDSRIDSVKHLVENHETDYLYTLFKSIDIIQHCFWLHMDVGDQEYGKAILKSYKRVDEFLAWLDTQMEANILVFSDHGFRRRTTSAPGPIDRLARGVDERFDVPGFVQSFYDTLFKSEVAPGIDNPGQTTGIHDNPAAWFGIGPDFVPGTEEIRFEDLSATILALCDHPIPEDYVGKPIDSLDTAWSVENIDLSIQRRHSFTNDDVVSERLHNLGYADMVDE
jgi:hypothetical protein